jgi:hypothetical protein
MYTHWGRLKMIWGRRYALLYNGSAYPHGTRRPGLYCSVEGETVCVYYETAVHVIQTDAVQYPGSRYRTCA